MSQIYIAQQKLFFVLALVGALSALDTQLAYSMNLFNNEIIERAGEALRDSRLAAQDAAGARAVAQQARQTAQNAQAMIEGAVANAVEEAENRMDNVANRIERDLNQRVNQAAQNAADGVRQQLNQVVAQANQHANRAHTQADRAGQQANAAQQHANAAQNHLNNVQGRINQAFNELEPQLRQAAINNAVQTEQARQNVLLQGQADRNANELVLHRDREEITRQNNLLVEEQRAQNELARTQEAARLERETRVEEIAERQRLGVFEQEAQIHADAQARAAIEEANVKWNKIQEMFGSFGDGFHSLTNDPKRIAKIAAGATAISVGIYAAKYGVPVLVKHLTQPRVVSETSKQSWFGWKAPTEKVNISDLTFKPELQKQLLDLALRVKTAKEFNENLPNVLFFGAPGTGKTAFAKALAYWSDLDYAITSGSEFAKITDLDLANGELRKLLDWAKTSDKGLIVFIDEAESLFANRMLPTTSKGVQDFINTFLALVSEKSQKNVMFIFATNHPFKLDDAITNRVGINVEFTLPEQTERIKILGSYLQKFAEENKESLVRLPEAIMEQLDIYAQELAGLAPRAIKFVAEEMIIRARRNTSNPALTNAIAQEVLVEAKISLQQTSKWETEREKWIAAQLGTAPLAPAVTHVIPTAA